MTFPVDIIATLYTKVLHNGWSTRYTWTPQPVEITMKNCTEFFKDNHAYGNRVHRTLNALSEYLKHICYCQQTYMLLPTDMISRLYARVMHDNWSLIKNNMNNMPGYFDLMYRHCVVYFTDNDQHYATRRLNSLTAIGERLLKRML